jgi:predicted DNA-binding transcriptional regulator AlpA
VALKGGLTNPVARQGVVVLDALAEVVEVGHLLSGFGKVLGGGQALHAISGLVPRNALGTCNPARGVLRLKWNRHLREPRGYWLWLGALDPDTRGMYNNELSISPQPQRPCRQAPLNHMDPSLTTKQAADMIGIKPVTLRAWKGARTGPAYVQVTSRCVRYRKSDVEKFISDRRVIPSVRSVGRFNATLRQTRQAL